MDLVSRFFQSDGAAPGGASEPADRLIANPLFILRIAGEPITAIAGLTLGAAVEGLRNRAAAGDSAHRLSSSVCALLEGIYPRLATREQKNALVTAKRDFYNLRSPARKTLDLFIDDLAEAERARIEAMLAALDDIAAAEAAAHSAYQDETKFIFDELTKRFSIGKLRDALQRSNPLLVEKLDRLRAGQTMSVRDSVALNMALFSYFHRTALKTSPRSSLTLVAPGTWTDQGSGRSDALALSSIEIERSIAARHGLIEWLLQPLLEDHSALGPAATIGINPTVRVTDDHLEWRRVGRTDSASQEISGITETTSRVKMNRGLALLLTLFDEAGPDRISLSALNDALRRRLPESAWPALPRVLAATLSQGILDASPAVPEQVDKLAWANHALTQMGDEVAARLRPPLQRFEAAIEACRTAAGGDSKPAYRDLEESFAALAQAAGTPLPIEEARPIVHEDCKVTAPSLRLQPSELGRAREDFPALLHLLPLIRGFAWPQFWLAARFLDEFGTTGRCDDPEAFLLAAAQDLDIPDRAAANGPTRIQLGQPPRHPVALAADAVVQSFLAAMSALRDDGPERRIPHDLIREHYAALPEALRRRPRSHCINAQLLGPSNDDRLMINAIYAGNARIMSRFIGDDSGMQAETRAYLGRLAGGKFAAIPGVFGFNVNIHPPLAGMELGLPLRRQDFGGSAIVPLDRLRIVYDEPEARIVLVNAEGEKITPFYFGMLNPRGLPALHRMLDWMSGAADSLLSIASGLASPGAGGGAGPAVQRRIALGRLVLTRGAQIAPISLMPDSRLDEYRFFVEFQEFCSRWAIPRETFFRFYGGEVVDSGNEANRQRAPKWRKPMHLDSHNPLAVRTLQRALRRHEGMVEFAEALPAPEAARVTVDGAKHVSELTFEIGLTGG
jgi:hypothetical protein